MFFGGPYDNCATSMAQGILHGVSKARVGVLATLLACGGPLAAARNNMSTLLNPKPQVLNHYTKLGSTHLPGMHHLPAKSASSHNWRCSLELDDLNLWSLLGKSRASQNFPGCRHAAVEDSRQQHWSGRWWVCAAYDTQCHAPKG